MSTLGGDLLSSAVHQAFDGPASLSFSCRCWRVEREAMVMTPPTMHDSAVNTLLPWLPSSLPQEMPSRVSSLASPRPVSLQSTAALALDRSTIPEFQLPANGPSRGPASLSWVYVAAPKTLRVSFHLGCHRSTVSLLNVSPLT